MYFVYNCFFYFLLLFVNIIYTRWCIIGQVLNGEWKELLIRQVIITSAPTNIFTPYMYAFLFPPTCICILSLRVCPPIHLRHVFLFPPMCGCNQSKRVSPPNTFTICIIFSPMCICINHYECAHQYIYNMFFYFRQ